MAVALCLAVVSTTGSCSLAQGGALTYSTEQVREQLPDTLAPDNPVATWTVPYEELLVFVLQGFDEDCPIRVNSVSLAAPDQVVVAVGEVPSPCAASGAILQIVIEVPNDIDANELEVLVEYTSGRQFQAELI